MIVPTVLGLVAGIAGGLASSSRFLPDYQVPSSSFGRPVSSVTAPLQSIEIADRLKRLNLPLYPRKAEKEGEALDRVILPDEAVGLATILTSDGWLVTHQQALKGGVLVAVDGRLVEPQKTVVDARTGAVFIKIETGPLPVAGFEKTELIRVGSELHAENEERQFVTNVMSGISYVEPKDRERALLSTERFSRVYRLDRHYGAKALGGAVLTAGGNLAGIVAPSISGDGGTFIPIHLFDAVLSEVFRGQNPRRAALGVNYIDLETVTTAGSSLGAKGAMLAASKKWGIPGVIAGSAAAEAGFKTGDIVLRVDDVEISGGRDLSEVTSVYRPGAKVKIEALRGGVREFFEVVLK